MADTNVPNDASAKSKPEGDRWESDSDAVERYDETTGDEGGGITNRPIGEEIETQAAVPERGESRDGAHAGHGDRKRLRPERGAEPPSESERGWGPASAENSEEDR